MSQFHAQNGAARYSDEGFSKSFLSSFSALFFG